jgi:CMP-N-acetylneuraminic acid synthetase
MLGGKPLLQYTAEAALRARLLSRVILSTDDSEIAEVGRRCGLDVPFLRPEDLARDETPTLPVVQHALRSLEAAGESYDAVCLLQPTTPFRREADIDACIRLLEESGAETLITVLPVPPEHNPHWVFFRGDDGYLRLSTGEKRLIPRRQDLPSAFHREGSVYVTRRDVIVEGNSMIGERLVGYMIDPSASVNLDRPEDWLRAEQQMRERAR